ncbi:MAG: cadmium-translocating P-type ATPase [Candidatus Paralactobacillus gallistercoris]|uniref:P-type Cu(+) transporter n=1 Tax=Candidatus Paralactobacillus gallistercoris TaxID=2838724 RepID=A0A948WZ73_9LACO|nr:cadmium-translocating P-type ATPase [Candidatus Paralactobacillus gallistercoris]
MNDMNMHHDHMQMNHDNMSCHDMGNMHMGNMKKDMQRKLIISVILTIPMILMSPFMGIKMPFEITFPGSMWIVALLGTIVFFYGGSPFFKGAKKELKQHQPAMMTLITMGIGVAYVYSIYAVIADQIFHIHNVMSFFWELATLVDIMLLGHIIEMDATSSAHSAVDSLSKLLPNKAHRIVDNQTQDVDVSALHNGDIVKVLAGEKIPADGVLISGSTSVDESMVTGEAKAVAKKVNSQVIGGSVNGDGVFTMKVTGTGQSGYLAKVMHLLSSAQAKKSSQETLANRVAGWLFYAATSIAIIAFIIWLMVKNLPTALSVAVTVLIVACPHALGMAIPLVIARSTAIAARHGLLIHNRNAMEQVKALRYALMDKTGTLTAGKFAINALHSVDPNYTDDQVLTLMASLEKNSNHPLAVGILRAAKQKQLTLLPTSDVQELTGMGLKGNVDNTTYQLVSVQYLLNHHVAYDQTTFKQLASSGNSISYLLANEHVLGYVAQGDQIKPNAKQFINELKQRHITPVMLTGDNTASATFVAKQLGIADVHAQLLPEDKEKLVRQYQKQGKVMMIGDGINDAPSLARADVGIAIGSGTDVAIDSADVVLVKGNLTDVINFLKLSHKTTVKMTENLWWGAGYNIIILPLAAGILAPFGFILNPMVGAILMSLSTVIVAINAVTLRDF